MVNDLEASLMHFCLDTFTRLHKTILIGLALASSFPFGTSLIVVMDDEDWNWPEPAFLCFAQKHLKTVRIALVIYLIYLACGPDVRRNAH